MAESEEPKTICKFLFKKSNKKFSGRKRNASDSDKGILCWFPPQCSVMNIDWSVFHSQYSKAVYPVNVYAQRNSNYDQLTDVLNQFLCVHQTEVVARKAVLWSERRKLLLLTLWFRKYVGILNVLWNLHYFCLLRNCCLLWSHNPKLNTAHPTV